MFISLHLILSSAESRNTCIDTGRHIDCSPGRAIALPIDAMLRPQATQIEEANMPKLYANNDHVAVLRSNWPRYVWRVWNINVFLLLLFCGQRKIINAFTFHVSICAGLYGNDDFHNGVLQAFGSGRQIKSLVFNFTNKVMSCGKRAINSQSTFICLWSQLECHRMNII